MSEVLASCDRRHDIAGGGDIASEVPGGGEGALVVGSVAHVRLPVLALPVGQIGSIILFFS